jgi:hypothetical protein
MLTTNTLTLHFVVYGQTHPWVLPLGTTSNNGQKNESGAKSFSWALSFKCFHNYKLFFSYVYPLHVLIYGLKFILEF